MRAPGAVWHVFVAPRLACFHPLRGSLPCARAHADQRAARPSTLFAPAQPPQRQGAHAGPEKGLWRRHDGLPATYQQPQGEPRRGRGLRCTAAAAAALRSFDYPPVAAGTVAYPLASIRADRLDAATGGLPGFGQLHPRTQGITTLGTIYSSSLFPGRAPAGYQELLCYIGGATNRGIVDQGDDAIVAQVDKDLRAMLVSPDAPPPRKIGVRVWPRAIPQFNVGHLDEVTRAKAALSGAGLGGVLLGGNYVAGVALGKCVEYGYEFAKQAAGVVAQARAKA